MKSATATKSPNGHGSCYKEVRFSPTATPIMRRAQSLPVNHPYHMNPTLGTQGDSSVSSVKYLDQAQSLLDRQRANFENERSLFAEERQLWEQERSLLKSKIADLELLLRHNGATVAGSTSPPGASAPHSSMIFQSLPTNWSESAHNPQVWEGSSPGSRPTRVFPEAEKLVDSQTSLSEQGATLSNPSLDFALSPRSHATDSTPGSTMSVPIEKLDSRLDGITLKSTALPPEIFARVMTPPSPLSRETSPSASQKAENKPGFKLRLSELGPPERNLVRDAGHTPMAVIDRDMDTELPSPTEGTIKEENEPLTPRALRQPAENSDSYFANLPDDPALKGPLSLVNDEEHDNDFLKELDQKLLGEARHVLGLSGPTEESKESETDASNSGEQEPELKLRSTTNFGTAFGDLELERYLAKQSFLA
ncbi:uncharacterized protein KD926_007873 [Aspergillus affinis]|uniref:uncharacterized protein n=1 Tax=Aspergillus affinis TaxID=1070780 RepID=UPI0022FE7ECF|nr:uncharacterized protein KD926_007873 [Aspergillus affinis]KAI9040657.1 hypothetical protein KD926_007873 [Aspergillus affinis]